MLYALHILELKTKNTGYAYSILAIIFTKVSETSLISFPSVFTYSRKSSWIDFTFSKAALNFYK